MQQEPPPPVGGFIWFWHRCGGITEYRQAKITARRWQPRKKTWLVFARLFSASAWADAGWHRSKGWSGRRVKLDGAADLKGAVVATARGRILDTSALAVPSPPSRRKQFHRRKPLTSR